MRRTSVRQKSYLHPPARPRYAMACWVYQNSTFERAFLSLRPDDFTPRVSTSESTGARADRAGQHTHLSSDTPQWTSLTNGTQHATLPRLPTPWTLGVPLPCAPEACHTACSSVLYRRLRHQWVLDGPTAGLRHWLDLRLLLLAHVHNAGDDADRAEYAADDTDDDAADVTAATGSGS